MDAYDVIIIGTGAGGGTLARHLAPSGKRILLLERGDWLPREPQNWLAQDVFVDNRYVSPDTWYDDERQAVPAADPLLRRRRDQALRRRALPAARRRTSASSGTTTGSRPRGRSPTTSSSPTTRGRSSSTRCTATTARIRPRAMRARSTRSRPSRTSPASSSSRTTSRRPATTRSTRPAGSGSTRPNPRLQRVRALHRTATAFPCLVHGKSDAEVLGVRPALEHPNVTLLTNAQAVKLETNDAGTVVTGVVVERDGETETLRRRHRRRRLRRGEHGRAAPALGERRASERARERLRPGRAQLHVPRQPRRARALARGEPDRSTRRRSA